MVTIVGHTVDEDGMSFFCDDKTALTVSGLWQNGIFRLETIELRANPDDRAALRASYCPQRSSQLKLVAPLTHEDFLGYWHTAVTYLSFQFNEITRVNNRVGFLNSLYTGLKAHLEVFENQTPCLT